VKATSILEKKIQSLCCLYLRSARTASNNWWHN
jgi:hypothetical protein